MGVALTRFRHLGEIRYAILCFPIGIGLSAIHKRRRTNYCIQFSFTAIFLFCRAGRIERTQQCSFHISHAVFHRSGEYASGHLGRVHASFLAARASRAPQDVTSVFESYAWQLYGGYTFQRFYELPGITPNMNGFNLSVVYYWKDWFGIDGEFAGTHATQDNVSSWFLFGGGGPRFRWSARKGIEVWAHALVGYSHFTPQTPAGSQQAFAYELGGGVDLPFKPRWAIRLGGDAMATTYFNTHQFSPVAHAGLVFRF